MAIKIGTISISLTAETSSFQAGMDKASQVALNSSRNIERSFTLMGTAIAGATTAAVGALGVLIERTEETVFSMQKMSQQAGISIESFSKFAYAAKVAGMPVDQLAVILTRISHSSFEAASGSLQAKEAYQDLGIKVQDANGHFKTADTIFLELANKLSMYKDSAAKTGIETMIMGRSGAQAAELLNVLATRFDEISGKAERLGVVFNMQTAVQSQALHDSFVDLEEAGLGLSVRLLNAVSPALEDVAQKIVAFVSNAENMKKIDEIGNDIAHGVEVAGKALEFLIEHAEAVKNVLEALALIRIGGMFGPMLLGATEATGIFGKLGIASLNLTGNLLGIRKMGTTMIPVLADMAGSVKETAVAYDTASTMYGASAARFIALTNAQRYVAGLASAFMATVAPAAAAAGAVYMFGEAIKGVIDYEALKKDTGASFWQIQIAEAEEAGSSAENFFNWLKTIAGFKGASSKFYGDVADILHGGDPTYKAKQAAEANKSPATKAKSGLKDLGALTQPGKVDQLQKKLDELKENARQAQVTLSLIGTTSQQQRDAEILDKYNKFLIDEKNNLDKLSPSKKAAAEAAAHEAITTAINTEALTKYRTELYDLAQVTASQIQEHLAMAAAVDKSAKAMQDAQVQAQVNKEFQKYGPNWQSDPDKLADSQLRAAQIRAGLNAQNFEADEKSRLGTAAQLEDQKRLNAAILQGAEARREAAILTQQASIVRDFADRGDTNIAAMQQQIDMVRQKSDSEKESADLERAAGMDAVLRYQQQKQAILDAVSAAQRYGIAIDYREVLAADKEAWLQYQDSQDKAILATGDMLDGFKVALSQLGRDAESTAQMVHDAFINAVSSMNDSIAKVITEKHQRGTHDISSQFSGAFRGIAGNLAKTGLQKGESALLGGLGMAGKPDGSQQKPWYVKVVSSGSTGGGGWASLMPGMGNSDQDSSSSSGSGAGSFISQLIGGVVQGAFADGTDSLIPGMPAIVGEKGPELFVPPAAGGIVPNSALKDFGNGGHTFNIDARGSSDPAQTVALVQQALKIAAPQITNQAVTAMTERSARTAPSARRS